MRQSITTWLLAGLLAGLLAACGSGAGAATTTLDRAAATTTTDTAAPTTEAAITTTTVVAAAATPALATTVDPEIEAIIHEWADAWVESDPDRLVALYAEDATYEDAAYPFERRGKADILEMVTNHLRWQDYTASPPLEITPTEDGTYVVDWIWAGTTRADGNVFIFEASTEFHIEDGRIVHSTDSYYRPSAPWSDE